MSPTGAGCEQAAGQERLRAGAPYAAAALAAVTEAAVHTAGAGLDAPSLVLRFLAVCLLALAGTAPPALLPPAPAALAVTAAGVLSLTVFRTATVAGAAVQVAALYRLGRDGGPGTGGRGAGGPCGTAARRTPDGMPAPTFAPGRRVAALVRRRLTRFPLRRLAPALAAPWPLLALLAPGADGTEVRVLTVLSASLAPAAVWAGIAVRARGEARVHRAAREVTARSLLEHTARGERARIARELHDVVAHHISMIAVQAETARLTTPGMPAAGAQRLSEIGATARAGLTEMRRLLGVLRQDAEPGAGAARRPQPGLTQLNELLDEARETTGTGLRLIVSGAPVPLDPGVELAAYRIAQEALTNARRHAPGAAVDVELHYAPGRLRLRIRDNGPGPGPAAPEGGHGLPGMRERAAAAGGSLRTGPAPGGGFLIEATLPAGAAERTA